MPATALSLTDVIHPCTICAGTGQRPGYEMTTDPTFRGEEACRICGGTGHRLVGSAKQIRELVAASVGL